MSTTTVLGQVGTDQPATHNKRNAVIVFTVIALFALSFFVGRATATSHVGSAAQVATHAQLSPANRAILATDVAAVSNAGTTTQLNPADRAEIATDVAAVSNAGTTTQLNPTDRAIVANDVAPAAPLSQANTTSCIAGRPC